MTPIFREILKLKDILVSLRYKKKGKGMERKSKLGTSFSARASNDLPKRKNMSQELTKGFNVSLSKINR